MGEFASACTTGHLCLRIHGLFGSRNLFLEKDPLKTPPQRRMMRGLQIIVAFSALLAVGYAIQCHQCNSHDNKECNKYDDNGVYTGVDTLTDCPGSEKYCRKILQVVRDEESIIRTCGSAEHRKAGDDEAYSPSKKGGYCYTTVMEEYNTEVCSCDPSIDGDGCNGASAFSAVSALTAVLTAIAAHRLF